MNSPQTSNFEVSTSDSDAAVQVLKDQVVAKMRTRIEKEIGTKNIRFSCRRLTEPRDGLVMNILWEVRADF